MMARPGDGKRSGCGDRGRAAAVSPLRRWLTLDAAMLDHDPLNYHPLANDRTTAIASADLLRFIDRCGHVPRFIDLAGIEREPATAAG